MYCWKSVKLFCGVIPELNNLFCNHLGECKVVKFSRLIAVNPKQALSGKLVLCKLSIFSGQIKFFFE